MTGNSTPSETPAQNEKAHDPSATRGRLQDALAKLNQEAPEPGTSRYAELAGEAFAAGDALIVQQRHEREARRAREQQQLEEQQARQRRIVVRDVRRIVLPTLVGLIALALVAVLPFGPGWPWIVALAPQLILATLLLFENGRPLETAWLRVSCAVGLAVLTGADLAVMVWMPKAWLGVLLALLAFMMWAVCGEFGTEQTRPQDNEQDTEQREGKT